jgi:glycosyltransferase involved in cell wall biosynthesis
MDKPPSLWLHLLTHNCVKDVEELTADTWQLFDGIIAQDHNSDDGTFEVLQSRVRAGKILQHRWLNDFSLARNLCLRDGTIKEGDWVFILDAPERVNPDFLIRLRTELFDAFAANKIRTVYQRSKPVLFMYHRDITFLFNPHTSLHNALPQVIDLSGNEEFKDDKAWVWSLRNPEESWIKASRYYFFSNSNHCQLVYEPQRFPNDVRAQFLAHDHAQIRFNFFEYCRKELGFEADEGTMKIYMHNPTSWPKMFVEFVEYEKILKSFFRYYVLNQDFATIYATENQWSIKEYLQSQNIPLPA